MEQRVDILDDLMKELARAQVQLDIAMKESFARQDALIAKMERENAEMKKNMDADTRAMKEDTKRMKGDTRAMKKAWGDLANKMGTVAEDVVAPNIPRLAVDEFGLGEVEDLMVRARRASRRGEKRRVEWDVVCSGPDKVVVVEVKSTPTRDKIREVPERLATFFDFFPEYEGRTLIGVFASWSIPSELLPEISQCGLYGIAMGEETMDVVARPA
jgi:hypothetical protein